MPFNWSTKDPDEVYEYSHDWADRLLVNGADVGDAMLTAANPDPAKRPTIVATEGDVEVFAIVPNGPTVLQYWVRGGTTKTKFEARIHTQQGRTYDESFILPVKER